MTHHQWFIFINIEIAVLTISTDVRSGVGGSEAAGRGRVGTRSRAGISPSFTDSLKEHNIQNEFLRQMIEDKQTMFTYYVSERSLMACLVQWSALYLGKVEILGSISKTGVKMSFVN